MSRAGQGPRLPEEYPFPERGKPEGYRFLCLRYISNSRLDIAQEHEGYNIVTEYNGYKGLGSRFRAGNSNSLGIAGRSEDNKINSNKNWRSPPSPLKLLYLGRPK